MSEVPVGPRSLGPFCPCLLPMSPPKGPAWGCQASLLSAGDPASLSPDMIAKSMDPRAEGAGEELSVTLQAWPGPRGEVVTLSRAGGEGGGLLLGKGGSLSVPCGACL